MPSIYLSQSEAFYLKRCLEHSGEIVREGEEFRNFDIDSDEKLWSKLRKASTEHVKRVKKQKIAYAPLSEKEINCLLKTANRHQRKAYYEGIRSSATT